MKKRSVVLFPVCLLAMSFAGFVHAHPDGVSIAVNFAADEPDGARSDVIETAGLLLTETWNNLDGAAGGPVALQADDQGEAVDTTVTVEWTSNNTWSSTGRGNEENNAAPIDSPDYNLMSGYLDTTATSITEVTISGIESAIDGAYDVYLYINGGVLGRQGTYTVGGESVDVVDDFPFDGSFLDGENYIVFQGLTGDSVTIQARATDQAGFRGPLNAVEIASGAPVIGGGPEFVRGDADSNGSINLTDGIVILNFLFPGATPPACLDAADTDDDGGERPTLTDAVIIFGWLFSGGRAPGEPTPDAPSYAADRCGPDPTDDDPMGCATTATSCGV
ncbi:MAG: hypothetical protein O7J95_08990 [Planctomycetota bacterium]|nr:hypothetical protein [Planctomycetota bacterium]